MDNSIVLARKERKRQRMLLDRARADRVGEEASRESLNSKSRKYSLARTSKATEAVAAKNPSSHNAAVERRNRKLRRKQLELSKSTIPWAEIRRHKESNTAARRNTERLALMFNCRECDCSPNKAHYLTQIGYVFSGYVMLCEHCLRIEWLPSQYSEAMVLSQDVRKLGSQLAHLRIVSRKPLLRRLMLTIDDMRKLAGVNEWQKKLLITTLVKEAEFLDATNRQLDEDDDY